MLSLAFTARPRVMQASEIGISGVATHLSSVVADQSSDSAADDDASSSVSACRWRGSNGVVGNLGTLHTRVNKDADAVAGECVSLYHCTVGLDTDADDVCRDIVLDSKHIGFVVLANTNEATLGCRDFVVIEDGIDRADGKSSVSPSIDKGVPTDTSVLRTLDGDVDTSRALDSESTDRHPLYESLYGNDPLVLGNKLSRLDFVSRDTNTRIQVFLLGVLNQACTGVLLVCRRRKNGTMALEVDAILVDDQLLVVRAGLDHDAIARRSLLDGVLDLELPVWLDVDGAAVLVMPATLPASGFIYS
ncbi:hypothetical protein HG530_006824 [Fusarium avenaceum]|nr:hypothetical protein HG530_006824 [Fusarium avenaceum]